MKEGVNKVAAYGQGFLLCYPVIRKPEPKMSKVTKDENIFCCLVLVVQHGLQMLSERDDQYIFVSQHSRKPRVSGRIFSTPINSHILLRPNFLFYLLSIKNGARKCQYLHLQSPSCHILYTLFLRVELLTFSL